MSNFKGKIARRELIRKCVAATPLIVLPSIVIADDHQLAESDPTAIALGYRHDASAVDVEKFPRRAGPEGARQFCENCKLYQAGQDGWGACSIFPGKQVKGQGWCNAWIAS